MDLSLLHTTSLIAHSCTDHSVNVEDRGRGKEGGGGGGGDD